MKKREWSRCEICNKRILLWKEDEHLCKKHREEKHKNDFSILADFIINGEKHGKIPNDNKA